MMCARDNVLGVRNEFIIIISTSVLFGIAIM